ncbi:MAG: HAMP domain-containing histidine kinase [Lachnospiraceae bacterium]|nr:HAMP domain-containing histidine kinase [Lachnospiraceae bacterium]
MKKAHEYGRGIKVFVTILETFFVVLCAVCIGIVSCNAVISVANWRNTLNVNYYISPFSKTAAFEDSDVFNDMVYDNLNDVMRYCVIRGQLETDGVFDETKEIDIEQYARHFEELPVTDTSIRYRLGDLLHWGQAENGISMMEYPYSEAEQMIKRAHGETDREEAAAEKTASEETASEETADIPQKDAGDISQEAAEAPADNLYLWKDGETVEIVYEEAVTATAGGEENGETVYEEYAEEEYVDIPIERYLPTDGQSILAHVENVEELEEMVSYLQDTVRMLGENYNSYKEYQKYFDQKEMNFQYCILEEKEDGRLFYSNEDIEGKSRQEIKDYFTGMGRHLYFSPAEFVYESNTSIREEQVRNIWSSYRYAYPDNTSVWIGVDTGFAYNDAFRSAWESYQKAAPGYLLILVSIVSALVAFVLFIAVTCMAGRKKGTDGVSLIWFDRWYTEIAMLTGAAVTGAAFIGTGASVSLLLYETIMDRREVIALLALGVLVTNAAFLFFWLSLIRRIKAKIFWNRFLVYRIFLRCKDTLMKLYDDSRNVVRIWVPYLLFLGVNLILPAVGGGGVFLAMLFDLGVGLFLYRNGKAHQKILRGIEKIRGGDLDYQIDAETLHGENRILAEAVNSIGNGIRQAVEKSMRDERMKADLITNVSHDIKTPLTSIINYVDLIKREPVENEKIKAYLEVLDSKSQRLKQLTEDLVEASKISSGNIELQCDCLDLVELMNQTTGEFIERFESKGLKLIVRMDESPLLIYADSRRIWRVIENLFNNAYKYALENTRVYVETKKIPEEGGPGRVRLSIKNISAQPISVGVEDLTERFIRGDASRTTEGSGLGLSIAKNLTELQKGTFEIISDGDLFKVVITFSLVEK